MIGIGFFEELFVSKKPKRGRGDKGTIPLLRTNSARKFLTDHLILILFETLDNRRPVLHSSLDDLVFGT